MTRPFSPTVRFCSFFALFLFLFSSAAHGQAPAPWSGIAADEARKAAPWDNGSNDMSPRSISADGRYVVFHSNIESLVPNDTNNWNDVFLRDRVTGQLSRVSVATGGGQANSYSASPTISANGRQIAFNSCATNLDPSDTNGICDVYVHDRELGTTTRVSLGPNDEQSTNTSYYQFALSADGRYVAFNGGFAGDNSRQIWVRDRDADGNGVFDEPGLSSTTLIVQDWDMVGDDTLFGAEDVAISSDGQQIAFTITTYDPNVGGYIGTRLFFRDRATGTTVRIDQPMAGFGEEMAYTTAPVFSEAGHLAYSSSAPNLTEDDTNPFDDVFVFNLVTGGNRLVKLAGPNASTLQYSWAPAISADGRYVAFMGVESSGWNWYSNVYAVDLQNGLSYEVSLRPDGTPDNGTSAPSITADGSAIAFAADAAMLVNGWGNRGVFVAETFGLSIETTDIPESGGTFTVELTAPSATGWTAAAWSSYGPNATLSPASGVGSTTLELTIAANTSGANVDIWVVAGSESLMLHQATSPIITFVGPSFVEATGGTDVEIYGGGFQEGATVTFGGVPATNVSFVNASRILATTPAHDAGLVSVVVTNPNGSSGTLDNYFFYVDSTPPVIVSTITGTLGANGWYVSDVSVTWSVQDGESEITTPPCTPFTQTSDVTLTVATCSATSGGGEASAEVLIRRDTTPPTVDIYLAPPLDYYRGEWIPLPFNCSDATSGVATCTTNQTGPNLDTSATGTFQFTVTAVDFAGHSTSTSVTYTVKTKTMLTITPSPTGVYGGSTVLHAVLQDAISGIQVNNETITFTIDGTSVGTAVTSGAGDAYLTVPLGTRTAGTHAVQADFAEDATARASAGDNVLTISKASVAITWPAPAFIVHGTPLSSTQLNATAAIPGSFDYTPAAGAIPDPGLQTLSVNFTPEDTTNYNSATKSVTLKVKAIPVITWSTPAPIVYLTALTGTQLNATADVAGTFVYNPAFGTVLPGGTQTLSVTFTPTNTADYVATTASVAIEVLKRTPTINWPFFDPIIYGTPLSSAQLHATSSAPGTLTYTPAEGTILPAGTQTLSVTFTPSEPYNYESATATASLLVGKAYPVVYWQGDLAPIVYGTPLTSAQLYASSPVAGTISYNPSLGAILNAGAQQISMTFTPDDAANYYSVTYTKDLTIQQAATSVTWPEPASITYGAALGATQLNATAPVAGTFTYTPPLGTILNAGPHSLFVNFTPTDAVNYAGSSTSVTLLVNKATPQITWSNPAAITYGTPLGWTQYNATVNVAGGSWEFVPPIGMILNAGAGQTLMATFVPDSNNYNAASATVSIDVLKASPAITWSDQGHIFYGTPLSAGQLNATANVPGTFDYSPSAGTILPVGNYTLSTTFTPADSANYAAATASALLAVFKQTAVVTWSSPAAITYGTALSGTQLNATASVPGTFVYSPPAGTVLGAGTPTIFVTFTPDDTANYQGPGSVGVALQVNKATPIITWANPSNIVYGTALSATQLNATANVAGSFAYSPASGTVLGAGASQTLSVTFTPTDAVNYNTAAAQRSITVTTKALTITTNASSKVYGQALPAFTVTATGFVNGDTLASLAGTLAYSTSATATSAPGSYTVLPGGVSSANYSISFSTGILAVAKASTSVAFTTTPNPSNNNQQVQLRAVISAVAPGAGTATGTVEFREGTTLLGTASLVNGVATFNKNFKHGTHQLTATYVGDANFNGSSASATHQTN